MFISNIKVDSLNSCDVLYSAYLNEIQAAVNYQDIANVLRNARGREAPKIFQEMAEVERGHAKSLAKRLDGCKGRSAATLLEPAWQSPETLPGAEDYELSLNIRPGISVDEAVQILQDAEKEAEQFYSSAALQTQDEELRELFFQLALEEARHCRLIPRIVRHALNRKTH